MKRNLRFVTVVITVLIALNFVAVTRADMVRSDRNEPYKSISPCVESSIEKIATIALRHISQARSDIHRKDFKNASQELTEALRFLENIKDDLSTTTARNLIRIARIHLEYDPASQVLPELSPIYTSLDMTSEYLPTDKAKSHLDRAVSCLEKNDRQGAEQELALADRALNIRQVELPLLKAQQFVTRANVYLDARNAKKADDALQAAERQTMSLFTNLNSPLFQAQKNIWTAYRNYSAVGKAAAVTELEKARAHLGRSATSGTQKDTEETGKLSQDVSGLQKKLAGEAKIPESVLKSVWERSKALAERAASYLSAAVAEHESTAKGEDNLIEAELHVAYAESYQMTAAEPDKTVRELDRAYSYLEKAVTSSLLDPEDLKKIRIIESMLQDLKAHPEKSDAGVQKRYDSVKEGLSDLKVKEELMDENQRIM